MDDFPSRIIALVFQHFSKIGSVCSHLQMVGTERCFIDLDVLLEARKKRVIHAITTKNILFIRIFLLMIISRQFRLIIRICHAHMVT
jgi:hypothetical protein